MLEPGEFLPITKLYLLFPILNYPNNNLDCDTYPCLDSFWVS